MESSNNSTEYVIGVDVGTGSARAGVFDLRGRMLASAAHPIKIFRPAPDHVEPEAERAQCDQRAEPVEVEIQELFAYPGEEATDFEVQDDHVDLETPVRDSIVLSLPFQPVCQPDCPGLDPVTGDKLAAGTVPETPIDDRWIALAALKADTTDHDADAARDDVSHTEKS